MLPPLHCSSKGASAVRCRCAMRPVGPRLPALRAPPPPPPPRTPARAPPGRLGRGQTSRRRHGALLHSTPVEREETNIDLGSFLCSFNGMVPRKATAVKQRIEPQPASTAGACLCQGGAGVEQRVGVAAALPPHEREDTPASQHAMQRDLGDTDTSLAAGACCVGPRRTSFAPGRRAGMPPHRAPSCEVEPAAAAAAARGRPWQAPSNCRNTHRSELSHSASRASRKAQSHSARSLPSVK